MTHTDQSIDALFALALALVFAIVMLWQYLVTRCFQLTTSTAPPPCCDCAFTAARHREVSDPHQHGQHNTTTLGEEGA